MNWNETSILLTTYYRAGQEKGESIYAYAGRLESHLSFLLSDEREIYLPIILNQILKELAPPAIPPEDLALSNAGAGSAYNPVVSEVKNLICGGIKP